MQYFNPIIRNQKLNGNRAQVYFEPLNNKNGPIKTHYFQFQLSNLMYFGNRCTELFTIKTNFCPEDVFINRTILKPNIFWVKCHSGQCMISKC